MTYARAVRFAQLVAAGADDATLLRDGYTELEIALNRKLLEAGETVRQAVARDRSGR